MSTPASLARVSALFVAVASALALAPSAMAGTASYDTLSGVVRFDAGALGEDNAVTFSDAGGGLVKVADANQAVVPDAGCAPGPDGLSAVCGDGVAAPVRLDAVLGDGVDSASTQVAGVPVDFEAGAGGGTLIGGDQADTLTGGDGADTLKGGPGDDVLDGGAGPDVLDGQSGGGDQVTYASRSEGVSVSLNSTADDGAPGEGDNVLGAEQIIGGSGDDTLDGDYGANTLVGGGGADHLNGEGGADDLSGGPGDDTLDGGTGTDTIDGGDGRDLLSYASRSVSVSVSLNGIADDGAVNENDAPSNVEDIAGGSAGDELTGDDSPNTILGNDGNDEIHGGGGADALDGGAGDDDLSGGAGGDDLVGGPGVDDVSYQDHAAGVAVDLDADVGDDGNSEDGAAGSRDTVHTDVENLTGSDGDDILAGSGDANRLIGGAGRDFIAGGGGADTIQGGDGNDTLAGGDENDTLQGGQDDDLLEGGLGTDSLDGGPGVDWVTYGDRAASVHASLDSVANDGVAGEADAITSSVEGLIGGSGPDVLVGNGQANYLDGGPGADLVTGLHGVDVLLGGSDDDTIKARDGEVDRVICGDGADGVEADAAEDVSGDCEAIDDGTAGGGGPGSGGSGGPGGGVSPPGAGDGLPSVGSLSSLIASILAGAQLGGVNFGGLQGLLDATGESTGTQTVDGLTASTKAAAAAASNSSRSAIGAPRSHPRRLTARLSAAHLRRLPARLVARGSLRPATKVGRRACGTGTVQAAIALTRNRVLIARTQLDRSCRYRLVLRLTPRLRMRRDSHVVVRFMGNAYQLPFTAKPALRLRIG